MIYIATIHWKTDKWIDIQLKYLKRFIRADFRIFTSLNHINKDHSEKFYHVNDKDDIDDHGEKLNILAREILSDSKNPDDILIFIDGDAFPITDLTDYLNEKLNNYPLIAIQRRENNDDIIAHPSFCATTVKFWKEIDGDWNKGYYYLTGMGYDITDVGSYLFKNLTNQRIKWYPLHRTNKKNFHPLFYGIYDDIIYHHGAGFRECVSSVDLNKYHFHKIKGFFQKFENYKSPFNYPFIPLMFIIRKYGSILRRFTHHKNKKENNVIYEKIRQGDVSFFDSLL